MARTAVAESLPPLQVDPALLGGPTTAKPQAVAAAHAPSAPPPEPAAKPPALAAPLSVAAATQVEASTQGASAVVADAASAPVADAAAAQSVKPPLVAERPLLPPLFSAYVAAGELPAPKLKPSTVLTPLPRDTKESRPTFISADHIFGRTDDEMVAEGAVELRKAGTVLDADRLTYWSLEDEVEALGNVRLQRDQDVFTGPKLRMKVEEDTGFFDHPTYTMPRTKRITPGTTIGEPLVQPISVPITARGEAERIDFQGENLYHLSKATYSTCAAGNQDWVAKVADLDLDYNREAAEGHDGKVVFKGVPILYSPWLSFSLDNQRKSGFLSPTIGSTNTGGGEFSLPWYWNIAPDKDATITPRVMQKRGVQWDAEYRYLYDSGNPAVRYENQARLEYLPDDLLEHKSRYSYSVIHQQNLGGGFTGNLNLTGVSDDTYFRDLSKPGAIAASTYLLRQGSLTYGASWWSASVLAQRYQVLQDPALPPVTELYRRLPQLNLTANRYDLPLGAVFNFTGEAVDFGHPTKVTGWRNTVYPQLSLPMQNSFLQVTPKIGVSVTHYALERQDPSVPNSLTRAVPIVSLDSSVTFERDAELLGRSLTQTLEPRLYYLYVPNRDQSQIPVFDTGLADFNFAQIFAENRYAGGDRIGDANQLTAAVTSRLIDPATGAELIRGVFGQRFYFSDQHVTLPAVIGPDGSITTPAETARTGRTSDLLAALSGLVMPKTYVDTGWEFNPHDKATERLNLGVRYQPETGKVLNAGYRYTRDLLGQIDVSAQWPLGGGWHAVGRYNYSTKDRQLIETVAGLEYDAGCWIARVVVQSIATQTQQATTSLFLQLELNGFSRIGSNPLDILKRTVPGYSVVNQPSVSPTNSSY
ncbi:MAG: LPS-assembly protein LptD [Rhodocyclaceae bacterium]|nr:LPS-assembly protein LptD [Rhodocyclaceae bacterium]